MNYKLVLCRGVNLGDVVWKGAWGGYETTRSGVQVAAEMLELRKGSRAQAPDVV